MSALPGQNHGAQPTSGVSRSEFDLLRDDLRALQREVARQEDRIRELAREKEKLKEALEASQRRETASKQDLERLRTEFRESQQQALRENRLRVLSETGRMIEELAEQTQKGLDALRQAISSRPTQRPTETEFQFSDDYPQEGITHVVERGETLSGIARRHNSTVRDIQNANRIARPESIQVGQTLFIPQRD
ncbi:MAG: LysM peptidoglycan-binding domain-containing protein [Opitutales bacterium]|nr:LysM peptidoglycan-binding domain-containing protein [Opitutales bacterium]MCH8541789.1 LysM peptidoglycan-binding domain-containing protein [Opitutales bacterium]